MCLSNNFSALILIIAPHAMIQGGLSKKGFLYDDREESLPLLTRVGGKQNY